MDFAFHMPVQVISGPHCLSGGGERLKQWGRRCLVVTGGHSAKVSGALDDALAMLEKAGIEATVFPGIGPNPLLTQCQAAAAGRRRGGGSLPGGFSPRYRRGIGHGRLQSGRLAGGQLDIG